MVGAFRTVFKDEIRTGVKLGVFSVFQWPKKKKASHLTCFFPKTKNESELTVVG
jgi:hypothetical protein